MRIIVDADGCPVVSEVIESGQKLSLPVLLICDTAHVMEREGAETLTVSKGADAVDFVLVNQMNKGDVVVTQDYGLAAMVLARGGYVMDQNGHEYTNDNILGMLERRHVAKKIRQAGGRMKGPKKRSKEANAHFQQNFEHLLLRLQNEEYI